MMIWLFATAFAAPVDIDEIAASEASAIALIADCEERSVTCGASRDDLGGAYLVRAVAGALLRGEVDAQAAANARHLAPAASEQWAAMLGGRETVPPQAYLSAWSPASPAVPAPSAVEPEPAANPAAVDEQVDVAQAPPPADRPSPRTDDEPSTTDGTPDPAPLDHRAYRDARAVLLQRSAGGPVALRAGAVMTVASLMPAFKVASRISLHKALALVVQVEAGQTAHPMPIVANDTVSNAASFASTRFGFGRRHTTRNSEMVGYGNTVVSAYAPSYTPVTPANQRTVAWPTTLSFGASVGTLQMHRLAGPLAIELGLDVDLLHHWNAQPDLASNRPDPRWSYTNRFNGALVVAPQTGRWRAGAGVDMTMEYDLDNFFGNAAVDFRPLVTIDLLLGTP